MAEMAVAEMVDGRDGRDGKWQRWQQRTSLSNFSSLLFSGVIDAVIFLRFFSKLGERKEEGMGKKKGEEERTSLGATGEERMGKKKKGRRGEADSLLLFSSSHPLSSCLSSG